MLSVQHLTTGYGKKQVLFDISFEASKGDVVLLTGGNGSGKSTVIKAIYGLLTPWENEDGTIGKIIFDGKDITHVSTFELLKLGIVYIPQKKNVFEDFTVEENLLTSASIYTRQEARQRMDKAFADIPQLAELKHRTPFSMSGGEKQLLAFGCALLHSPKLMLLDEPFAGVDADNVTLLMDTIKYLKDQHITFIIVEHKRYLFDTLKHKRIKIELGKIKK